jgi:hypothetical protein
VCCHGEESMSHSSTFQVFFFWPVHERLSKPPFSRPGFNDTQSMWTVQQSSLLWNWTSSSMLFFFLVTWNSSSVWIGA